MPARPADNTQLVVLSLLKNGPAYGYAISKEVAARSDNQLRLTPATLYPVLRQMEAQGLIAATWEEVKSDRSEGDAEGRRRKWYTLTAKGRRRLDESVKAHYAWRSLLDLFVPGPRGGEKLEGSGS